jgi:hypothetical protein
MRSTAASGARLSRLERLEPDHARPLGARLEQLRPRDTEQQGRSRGTLAQELEQLEQRGFRPLDVVDHRDERTVIGEALDERPDRVGNLPRRRLAIAQAHEPAEVLRDACVAGERLELRHRFRLRVVVVDPRGLADDLCKRPVRDAVAVGETAAPDDGRVTLDPVGELAHEPRLTDARLADERDEAAPALLAGEPQRVAQALQLLPAPDERRVVATRQRLGVGAHAQQAVRRHGLGLPLQVERGKVLRLDRLANEVVCGLADEDLPRSGCALEPRSGVSRVARDEVAVPGQPSARHRPGSDPRAGVDLEAAAFLEVGVHTLEAFAHRQSGPACPQRVVLVRLGHPEDGHERIADELLHPAAVLVDDRLHRLVVGRHHVREDLGIDARAERRRADDVGEEHRHGLAEPLGGFGGERRAAGQAEARPLGVFFAAICAKRHLKESRARCRRGCGAGTLLDLIASDRAFSSEDEGSTIARPSAKR